MKVTTILTNRLQIFLAPLIVTFVTVGSAQTGIRARKTDEFVDSMGINVHMEYKATAYGRYQAINDRLRSLGMRHFRDEVNHADPSVDAGYKRFVKELNTIGNLGYTLTGLIEGGNDYPKVGTRLDPTHVEPMIKSLLPTLEALEGPNEPDDGGFVYGEGEEGENEQPYPQGAINESRDLWRIVKNDYGTRGLPILAMSEGNPPDFGKLANLVKLGKIPPPIDYTSDGNMHSYQNGGIADNGLDSFIRLSRDWTGKEPLWTTEMGYHNNTSYLVDGEQQGVSERASAIYLPIAFLSAFNKGVARTFSYELVDEAQDPPPHCSGTSSCSGEGYYGVLNSDLTPKPAFTALQNLIEILREPGQQFEPESLEGDFSGAPDTMRFTLLQKSNGDYYLVVWNDISVYQTASCNAQREISVPTPMHSPRRSPAPTEDIQTCTKILPGKDLYPPDVPVTVIFRNAQAFTIYAPNNSSGTTPTDAYTISANPRSLEFRLPPKVLVIRIAKE